VKPVVFLGPTLAVGDARAILDADYRPPAAMGDVYLAVCEGARTIGIVDGLFERTPAVWHKEILWALSRGVRVVGSSSMGALRAAELHAFGMEGVGRVFADYRDGVLVEDDAVAVVHGPAADRWRALSEPFVNLRDGLARARAAGLLSDGTRDALTAIARATFYPERSWPALIAAGRAQALPVGELTALDDFVRATRPNLKRDDALALLDALAAPRATPAPAFSFESTSFWRELVRTVRRTDAGGGALVPVDALSRHLRAGWRDRDPALRDALELHLVDAEAQRRGIEANAVRVATAAELFRRRQGLLTATATHEWLAARGLSHAEFTEAMRIDALAAELLALSRAAVDDWLVLALKLRGDLGAVAEAAARKHAWLERRGHGNPSLAEAGVTVDELHAWYVERFGPVGEPWEEHARRVGFSSYRDFAAEVLGCLLFERDGSV
jgi:hypothetical protein